jgi:hypothetical protein
MTTFKVLGFGLVAAALALTVGCSDIPIPGVSASAPTALPTEVLPTLAPKVAVAAPTATLVLAPSTPADAAQVVAQFFQAVNAGDVDKAMTFWSLYEPDQPADYAANMRKIVSEWANGKHQITVGGITYAGLVAPGDYRPLAKDDPRVTRATANVRIDGSSYSLSLVFAKGGWLIQGITTP